MKVVINRCYGGFVLSDECSEALGGVVSDRCGTWNFYKFPEFPDNCDWRTNPKLIELIETKGSEWCSGCCSKLKVVEIPDGTDYIITDYDGMEQIEEAHRVWY